MKNHIKHQVLCVMYSLNMCHTSQIQCQTLPALNASPLHLYSQGFGDKINTSLCIYGSMAVDLVSACINSFCEKWLLRKIFFKTK